MQSHLMQDSIQRLPVTIFPDGRVDPKNAAAYCGLSVKTMANMRSRGEGPRFIKRGGRVFYRIEDLDEWNRGGTFNSTAQARLAAQTEGQPVAATDAATDEQTPASAGVRQ